MRCLITGAAGFVGTNLALKLLKEGHEVIGTDSLSRKGSELNLKNIQKQFPNFDFKKRQIEDMPSLIAKEKPEIVYHCAAQVAVTSSVESPESDFRVNAEGTFRIARAASDIDAPIIYMSTNKVFGNNVNNVPIKELDKRYEFDGELGGKGVSEDFPIDASKHTPYGSSKLVGDIYTREFGGVVNRCSCMYGPNQHGIVDQGWISFFAIKKIKGEPIKIFGDGKQVRDAVHINDVTDLLKTQGEYLLDSSKPDIRGEVFNIGGGHKNTTSLLELCDRWDISPTMEDWRPSDQKVFYCDISKAKRVLGWEPKIGLDEGLKDLYSWVEQNYKPA
jgi:CDP-paratose 2-epimerase